MKNLMSILFVAFAMFSITTITLSCEKTELTNTSLDDATLLDTRTSPNTDCVLYNPSETITTEEAELLKYMREEEKLARDVYIYFFNKYNAQVFQNISKSEQRHMEKILCLLDYYEIEDPALAEEGEFTNAHIKELYDALIAAGDVSLLEAYKVGATIEDVDIKDLEDYSLQTENPAILDIFSNLTCGSRNHMRAFYPLVISEGGEYTAQYITQEELEAIINSDSERCGNNTNSGKKGGNGTGVCVNDSTICTGNGTNAGNGFKGGNGKKGNGTGVCLNDSTLYNGTGVCDSTGIGKNGGNGKKGGKGNNNGNN
ncbi:MAG: DUF2202 domain-containing protein [Saprospiraceae bacterium]